MGGLLPSRKNPLSGQGIMPGTSLRLLVEVGGLLDVIDARVAAVEEARVAIVGATAGCGPFLFQLGSPAEVYFERDRTRLTFKSMVLDLNPDGRTAFIALPAAVEAVDRRVSYRLETALRPFRVYPLLAAGTEIESETSEFDDCVVVDLSFGGVCVVSPAPACEGDWLGIELNMPPLGELSARMRVVRLEPPRAGGRKHRLHCAFVGLSRHDQDRVHRFLLHRQLALRRWGGL